MAKKSQSADVVAFRAGFISRLCEDAAARGEPTMVKRPGDVRPPLSQESLHSITDRSDSFATANPDLILLYKNKHWAYGAFSAGVMYAKVLGGADVSSDNDSLSVAMRIAAAGQPLVRLMAGEDGVVRFYESADQTVAVPEVPGDMKTTDSRGVEWSFSVTDWSWSASYGGRKVSGPSVKTLDRKISAIVAEASEPAGPSPESSEVNLVRLFRYAGGGVGSSIVQVRTEWSPQQGRHIPTHFREFEERRGSLVAYGDWEPSTSRLDHVTLVDPSRLSDFPAVEESIMARFADGELFRMVSEADEALKKHAVSSLTQTETRKTPSGLPFAVTSAERKNGWYGFKEEDGFLRRGDVRIGIGPDNPSADRLTASSMGFRVEVKTPEPRSGWSLLGSHPDADRALRHAGDVERILEVSEASGSWSGIVVSWLPSGENSLLGSGNGWPTPVRIFGGRPGDGRAVVALCEDPASGRLGMEYVDPHQTSFFEPSEAALVARKARDEILAAHLGKRSNLIGTPLLELLQAPPPPGTRVSEESATATLREWEAKVKYLAEAALTSPAVSEARQFIDGKLAEGGASSAPSSAHTRRMK